MRSGNSLRTGRTGALWGQSGSGYGKHSGRNGVESATAITGWFVLQIRDQYQDCRHQCCRWQDRSGCGGTHPAGILRVLPHGRMHLLTVEMFYGGRGDKINRNPSHVTNCADGYYWLGIYVSALPAHLGINQLVKRMKHAEIPIRFS